MQETVFLSARHIHTVKLFDGSKYFTDMNISDMDSNLTTLINVNNVTSGHVTVGQQFQYKCNSDCCQ